MAGPAGPTDRRPAGDPDLGHAGHVGPPPPSGRGHGPRRRHPPRGPIHGRFIARVVGAGREDAARVGRARPRPALLPRLGDVLHVQ